MSIDRRISLDTAIAQGMPDLNQSDSGTGTRREASQGDRQAFERALAQDAGDAQKSAPAPATPTGAFGLFAAAPQTDAAVQARASALASALCEHLSAAARQLLVDDGAQGRREVRVTLDDERLPGLTVSVFEEGGRVVAAFVCAVESTRERMNEGAAALAAELAASLSRATLVRVSTDDPEDPCLTETRAEPDAGAAQPSTL
ncbi:hypothetical protein [Bordetella genomosp. 5]|uniref:Uncharacterized protein n=1 Tax=Bordetella genomosp. 5 TaxID=1395608 RepID=A0A261TC37_9BORD|nr:hypothetical protein [Bordetella genomosp. 5]OZI46660.1 hypothetical protein CAL25_18370 [Bordetella genomosp. 5]